MINLYASKAKKYLTEEEGEGEGGEGKNFAIVITSSRCKLFCGLFVVQLILYRELSLCWDGSIKTVALG
mgnify:CR=1 FL=1